MPKLRTKHKRFADEWLKHQNGQKAAVDVGYSEKYARNTAYKILQRPEVQAYIKEQTGKYAMPADEALELLGQLARKGDSESVRLRAIEKVVDIHGLTKEQIEGELTFRVLYGSDDTPEKAPPKAAGDQESSGKAEGDLHGAAVRQNDTGGARGC